MRICIIRNRNDGMIARKKETIRLRITTHQELNSSKCEQINILGLCQHRSLVLWVNYSPGLTLPYQWQRQIMQISNLNIVWYRYCVARLDEINLVSWEGGVIVPIYKVLSAIIYHRMYFLKFVSILQCKIAMRMRCVLLLGKLLNHYWGNRQNVCYVISEITMCYLAR